jgi:acetylornithine deacetylase/succinyl-diaminopimelate desuccinylase-like protein
MPDVVVLTEGTGDAVKGALGIYRGQRGRMQIEVTVVGRSCHGSMPFEGLNPLEHGAAILAEAARRHVEGTGFADHPVVGRGTRTASWSSLDTPSDCAVPARFTFRFDRRLTVGETPEQAVADIEALDAVAAARTAGLTVTVEVPRYTQTTWNGCAVDNLQIYPGWITPEDHPAIRAAVDAYRRVVTPFVAEPVTGGKGATLRREPRVGTWIFSTDGVGFPVAVDDTEVVVPPAKAWVVSGAVRHPAMFGIGAGVEQNTHRIGEYVDSRELRHAIATLARFPRSFVEMSATAGVA